MSALAWGQAAGHSGDFTPGFKHTALIEGKRGIDAVGVWSLHNLWAVEQFSLLHKTRLVYSLKLSPKLSYNLDLIQNRNLIFFFFFHFQAD